MESLIQSARDLWLESHSQRHHLLFLEAFRVRAFWKHSESTSSHFSELPFGDGAYSIKTV
jgi:hypothetical protein